MAEEREERLAINDALRDIKKNNLSPKIFRQILRLVFVRGKNAGVKELGRELRRNRYSNAP